jgi:small ligand-binding sensory domain FIST
MEERQFAPFAEGVQSRFVLSLASGASDHPNASRAAEIVAEQVAAGLSGARASAAVFFATTTHGPGYGVFERAIAEAAGTRNVIGCSASGVFGGVGEIERGPGVSALAFAGDVEARRFFVPGLRGRAEEVGREIGRTARELDRDPGVILLLADSYNAAPDELLAGIEASAPGIAVIGGGATEDGTVGETTVIARGTTASNAVVGLVIGGVRCRLVVSPSCTICEPWWTVTEARGHRVLALDGSPALPMLLARLGGAFGDDQREVLRSILAAIGTPGSERDLAPPYVLRAFVGADAESGALLVGDEVFAGMRLAIAVRDPVVARETLAANLERFVADGAETAGALYFNGVERGERLYGITALEGAYLRHVLGDLPIAGLYCHAGFAPLGGRNRFHQHAGILVGLEAD